MTQLPSAAVPMERRKAVPSELMQSMYVARSVETRRREVPALLITPSTLRSIMSFSSLPSAKV